jgi:predicted porin
MKKSLLALAALTAFTGVAYAQSSVTLFGIVDLAGRNVKNGSAGDRYSLSQDGIDSSRIGFRGVEDLGGGLRAGFHLEAGLGADNGTVGGGNGGSTANGAWFNRRSTVSLLGNWGEVRLGRDYVPSFWNHTAFDPFGTNGVGSHNNLMFRNAVPAVFDGAFGNTAGAQTFIRANNAVAYHLPAWGGLYGQATVAAGEGQIAGNKYMGARIGFAAGPFDVAGAYGATEQAPGMSGDVKEFNIGGSWNFGFLKLMGLYAKLEEGPVNRLENWLIGARMPFGASTVKASYGESDIDRGTAGGLSALNGAKAKQFAIGYQYDLSKRTALYANYSALENDAGLSYTASTSGPPAGLPSNGLNGFKSTGYEFGVRHAF